VNMIGVREVNMIGVREVNMIGASPLVWITHIMTSWFMLHRNRGSEQRFN